MTAAMRLYALDEQGEPFQATLDTYKTMLCQDRTVAMDIVRDCTVHTIFLGVDLGDRPYKPVLWETRVFGGAMDGYATRCGGSRGAAQLMHAGVIKEALRRSGPLARFKRLWKRLTRT
jgi:hypothetical protein